MSIRFGFHLGHQTNKILAILFKIKEYRDTNFKSSCTSEVRKNGKVNPVGAPAKMFVGGCSKGMKSLRRTTERHRKNKQISQKSQHLVRETWSGPFRIHHQGWREALPFLDLCWFINKN